jgi:hypothetical protein
MNCVMYAIRLGTNLSGYAAIGPDNTVFGLMTNFGSVLSGPMPDLKPSKSPITIDM